MNDLILNILSGFLGALFLYLIQEYIAKRNRRKISDNENEKIVDREIIEKLFPGTSFENAKRVLGTPLIHKKSDFTIYGNELETNSYIFKFKNALLKITTKDNIQIDTITMLLNYGSKDKIKFIPSIFDDEVKPFGKCIIDKFILDLVRNHTSIRTMKVSSCALEINIPNPLYKHFTYFCEPSDHLEKYYNSDDINDLSGAVIFGVCVSGQEKLSFFIYDYEYR